MNSNANQLSERFLQLKKERSAYVIAHYYQRPEVQDVADFVGDSYTMALAARDTSAEIVLVAGVDFMAETAYILSPDKMILTPEPQATCPMANEITAEKVREYKRKFPDTIVVCYVNTPAEVKAESDVCCTSSNAVRIIQKLPLDARILFIPDPHLGFHVGRQLNRPIELFDSVCPTHEQVRVDELKELIQKHPEAKVLVHPECSPEVVDLADFAGSTKGIIDYASSSDANQFIIGTEMGILHPLRLANPDKEFILATKKLICPDMKSITMDKMVDSLENLETRVHVEETVRVRALVALEKMIELSS